MTFTKITRLDNGQEIRTSQEKSSAWVHQTTFFEKIPSFSFFLLFF